MTTWRQKLITKGFQSYWRMTRGLSLSVAAAVIDNADRVLLRRSPATGLWEFPGGPVAAGQSAEEAITRHLAALEGVTLAASPRLFALYTLDRPADADHCALFVVEGFDLATETPSLARRPAHDLDHDGARGLRARLAEMREKAPQSPTW